MAHFQEEEQAARKKAGQGAVHKVTPEDLHGRKPRIDELPTDAPQDRTDAEEPEPETDADEPGQSGGTGQGRSSREA